jgi:protease I
MTDLAGLRVAVVATDGFEEAELTEPVKALKEAGAQVTIVAPKGGEIQGFLHDTKSRTVKVDRTINDVRPDDFDAVELPGGALNADALRVVPGVQQFLKAIDTAGKPIAVICHGSWSLVSAGLVNGRKLTSYHTIRDDVKNAGGTWVDQEVVVDRNWVSSRQPADIPAFNREMIKLFSESRKASR